MSDEDGLSRNQYQNIIANKQKPLFVKFTASWCGPCQAIAPFVNEFLMDHSVKDKIEYLEIDIDESLDVFAFMKKMKMLNGVPSLLFYNMENKTFAPTMTVSTGNKEVVKKFLNNVKQFL